MGKRTSVHALATRNTGILPDGWALPQIRVVSRSADSGAPRSGDGDSGKSQPLETFSRMEGA